MKNKKNIKVESKESVSQSKSSTPPQIKWFKKFPGVLVPIFFTPFFLIWYSFSESNWTTATKVIVALVSSIIAWCYIFFYILFVIALIAGPSTTNKTYKELQVKDKIEFTIEKYDDPNLLKGEEKITQDGVEGEVVTKYKITYEDNKEISREKISEEIIKQPVAKKIATGTKEPEPTPAPAPAPAPTPTTQTPSNQGSVYYANCSAARAAGAAPIYRGQPGYRAALDRDNDGVACE